MLILEWIFNEFSSFEISNPPPIQQRQKIRIEASDIIQDSRILDKSSQGKEFTLAELLKYMISERKQKIEDWKNITGIIVSK